MGVFSWLTGSRAAPTGVAREPVGDLRKRLLGLNRKTAPWTVRDGKPEGVDLVAEWRIVDAEWYEIFAKAGIQRVFKVLIKFDEARAWCARPIRNGRWNGARERPTCRWRDRPSGASNGK